MREEDRKEGRKAGRKKGRKTGKEEGRKERWKEGRKEGGKEGKKPGKREGTSRPKARDGHRYPCPALVFPNGSSYASRAAAPEGTGGNLYVQLAQAPQRLA